MQQGFGLTMAGVIPLVLQSGLCVSSCSFQQPVGETVSGGPTGNFADIPTLINLVCMDAPYAGKKLSAVEMPTQKEIESMAERHMFIPELRQDIVDGWRQGWRVNVTTPEGSSNTRAYDVRGVETDSQSTQTRLKLELVKV